MANVPNCKLRDLLSSPTPSLGIRFVDLQSQGWQGLPTKTQGSNQHRGLSYSSGTQRCPGDRQPSRKSYGKQVSFLEMAHYFCIASMGALWGSTTQRLRPRTPSQTVPPAGASHSHLSHLSGCCLRVESGWVILLSQPPEWLDYRHAPL